MTNQELDSLFSEIAEINLKESIPKLVDELKAIFENSNHKQIPLNEYLPQAIASAVSVSVTASTQITTDFLLRTGVLKLDD